MTKGRYARGDCQRLFLVKKQKTEQMKAARLAKATAKASVRAAEAESEERWPIRTVEQEEGGRRRKSWRPRIVLDYRRISTHTDAACNTCFEGRSLF